MNPQPVKIPLILDTDIGTDIDDTWALAFLLQSPELDLKLVTSATGDTTYRACLAAKFLQAAGRADVTVGVGLATPFARDLAPQAAWVGEFGLQDYAGKVASDGVAALVETILGSPEPVTLVCIGPLTNIAAALQREPGIARRARFVGMHGSLRLGYNGASEPMPEYNVVRDIQAAQTVFCAPWREMVITPLDTCGLVRLAGEKFASVRDCPSTLAQAVIQNYWGWIKNIPDEWAKQMDAQRQSSVLFDTVAVYLAFAESLLVMEDLPVKVNDEGMTVIDPTGQTVRCAMHWKDLGAFEDLLVERLVP
jgi:inosine-uridine nucleoside N-ribohydrolase